MWKNGIKIHFNKPIIYDQERKEHFMFPNETYKIGLVAELEKHQYIKSYTMKKKLQQHLMKNDNEDDVISLESDSL